MKRIKLWLMRLLLWNLCEKSSCKECYCFDRVLTPLDECAVCVVLRQAVKVWGDDND